MNANNFSRFLISAHCPLNHRDLYQSYINTYLAIEEPNDRELYLQKYLQAPVAHGEILRLLTKRRGQCKKRILALEPHSDDVIFSAGGYILSSFEEGYTLRSVCIFSQGGIQEEIRHLENTIVWEKCLSSDTRFVQLLDAPFRIISTKSDTAIYAQTYRSVLNAVKQEIEDFVPDVVLSPIGIGGHVDHILTHAAAIQCAKKFTDLKFMFYEDYPYCIKNRYTFMSGITDAARIGSINPVYHEISSVFQDKVTLQYSYMSQHKFTKPQVEKHAHECARVVAMEGHFLKSNKDVKQDGLYERFWMMDNEANL